MVFLRTRTYTALLMQIAELREAKARAEAGADWLRTRVNQVEREAAALRADATGKPQVVPRVDRVANPNVVDDYREAVLEYDDMGDTRARALGVDWDADGRVKYQS